MPETARPFKVTDTCDPQANNEGGMGYLRTLLDRFPEGLALAASNGAATAVERFQGAPPYAETRDYVSRILAILGR